MTTWNAAPMPELGLELVRDVDRERIRSRLPRWDPRVWGDAAFLKNTRPGKRLLKLGLAWGRERVKAGKLQQENVTLAGEVAPVSRFTGKEEDVEVGLQYFGKRFRSPYLGRWMSADPLAVHVPGEADLNLYAYVSGHVLKNVDPVGLQEAKDGASGQPSRSPEEVAADQKKGDDAVASQAANEAAVSVERAEYREAVGDEQYDSEYRTAKWQSFQNARTLAAREKAGESELMRGLVVGADDPLILIKSTPAAQEGADVGTKHYAVLRLVVEIVAARSPMSAASKKPIDIKAVAKEVKVLTASAARGAGQASEVLLRTGQQLQAKFKHAKDFGVVGNYSKANAAEFSRAIHQHINSPGVRAIQGTYHKQPVTHYLDPSSGLNAMADPAGNFISGWKLSPGQLQNVVTHGGL